LIFRGLDAEVDPKCHEELFNYKHSSLRNVIERCFGVLKRRWSILKTMCSYSFSKQTNIVLACCAIHNFIRMHAQGDSLFFLHLKRVMVKRKQVNQWLV
ncbi:hypothetical protein LINPERHAP2_LOCUS11806, partial [Linum perenne]